MTEEQLQPDRGHECRVHQCFSYMVRDASASRTRAVCKGALPWLTATS
jgi:hypothetical protein